MCSIYGIMYYRKCSKNLLQDKMSKMSTKTEHRGPDEKQIQYFDNAAIGMNRLSIIGPKEKAAMVQRDRNLYSVLNGEIVNYRNLSKELGCNINCDSQIILPMFRKYNESFIKKLGGMFAIAIYDENQKKLCLWRDSLGVKPLYYYSNDEYFMFASEIKAIYSAMDIRPEVDFIGIDNILRYGCNPGKNTVFQEIKKVLPGEKITVVDSNVKCEKYWNLKNNVEHTVKLEQDRQSQIKEFGELMQNIVQENTYTDVPGGFFLSGGLDSSLMMAMALENKESKYNVPISIRFLPNGVEDEEYVKFLEGYFKRKVEWVDITPKIARNTLEELIKFIDEPLENPTHVGTYLMSKRAKELGLKTIITGDGADELFLGYKRQECWLKYKDAKSRYPELNHIIPKSNIELLYKKELLEKFRNKKYIPEDVSNIEDALVYERGERLPEYHNMRLDRMTMAHGIEAKVPFEDYRVADYSFNISINELSKNGRKSWLKNIATKWLPENVIYRKKSIFPSLPDEWISGDGIEWAKKILLNPNSKIDKYIERKALENLLEKHILNKEKKGRELWALITLELWLNNLKNWK